MAITGNCSHVNNWNIPRCLYRDSATCQGANQLMSLLMRGDMVSSFHATHAGDVRLVLEAKVDVRDGLAWSSLDKYIKGLEGGGAAPAVPPGPHDSEAATAAAAAAGAADSEEEADPGPCTMCLHLSTVVKFLATSVLVCTFLKVFSAANRVLSAGTAQDFVSTQHVKHYCSV